MRFKSVETLERISTEKSYYDLAIFSSGFEERATHIARSVSHSIAKKTVVLAFENASDVLSREDNDRYFLEWSNGTPPLIATPGNDQFIFELLNKCCVEQNGQPIKILVDYSVMTRTWYSAILTWARFSSLQTKIELDFVYACGKYLSEFGPLSISEIVSLPGFEGVSGGFRRTTAFFGLGYDKYATLAVYDRLEPDSIYCCIAQRYLGDQNAEKVLRENDILVDAASGQLLHLPLTDVSLAFSLLSDQILSLDRTTHMVMVPMGPKTHVLATLLAALRMPWITCLHAKGERSEPVQVEAAGPLSISRVVFQG